MPTVDGQIMLVGIKVDGTSKATATSLGAASSTVGNCIAYVGDLDAGEVVTLYCHHQAGTAKTTEASTYGVGFSIQRIA